MFTHSVNQVYIYILNHPLPVQSGNKINTTKQMVNQVLPESMPMLQAVLLAFTMFTGLYNDYTRTTVQIVTL